MTIKRIFARANEGLGVPLFMFREKLEMFLSFSLTQWISGGFRLSISAVSLQRASYCIKKGHFTVTGPFIYLPFLVFHSIEEKLRNTFSSFSVLDLQMIRGTIELDGQAGICWIPRLLGKLFLSC